MAVLDETVKNVNASYSNLSNIVKSDQKDQFERVISKLNDEWEQVAALYM